LRFGLRRLPPRGILLIGGIDLLLDLRLGRFGILGLLSGRGASRRSGDAGLGKAAACQQEASRQRRRGRDDIPHHANSLNPNGGYGTIHRATMVKAPPTRRLATATPAGPRVRRGYFECRYGQLHVHNAIPPGGGFDEGTPLLCLHPSPLSGYAFRRFLAVAGVGRSVFAPDLPGFGDSDPPPPGAGVAGHAAAIGDFLDAMRLRQLDVLGHRFGALVAAELAALRPAQVRRIVLVSPPDAAVPQPPSSPAADGAHLLTEWGRAAAYCGPGASPEVVTAALAQRLRNSAQAAAASAAERGYPLRARLAQLSAPLLMLRLREEIATETGQPRDLPARARLMQLPEHGASLFETAPEAAAKALEAFLR
jgi:pimeloyl-ACP methyl ester carboxylesterase